MGHNRTDKSGATGSVAHELVEMEERMNSSDISLAATLAEHFQKFNDILNAVIDIKATLELKIDSLRIDMGHLREYHKKLKERVEATENAIPDMQPLVSDATSNISALQKEKLHL
ncbi:hypothetical protein NDU88_003706 [Pleurodeles waltl]|uniref:Uncharacterized protein n=1 Tax=Pleurodeles waltl TaxID=8319 RepID=A0AAV7NHF6_PLEWA|nr:hypothetical protein NDU88_003706 [Pleurodeles waltl]